MSRFELTPAHIAAANRTRRTILHYDAYTVAVECGSLKAPDGMTMTDAYRMRLWGVIDHLPNQIDSIHWDACFLDQSAFCRRSQLLPVSTPGPFEALWNEGMDAYDEYISGCRQRGLECILTHRVSGTDMGAFTELKCTHPEYYLKDWMEMADMASPGMRQVKLDMFREILELYDFDGYEIDFCRHTPFLEPGRQWELRECVTQFMRDLRALTLSFEERADHPILLSARVPRTPEGCREDGLDIETWANEALVDTLTVGSRAFEVDIPGFRRVTGSAIPLFPCFDAHHQTDGYADPAPEVLHGVFANWWAQGADGIVIFNQWACDVETYRKTAENPFTHPRTPQPDVIPVMGDPALLCPLDKTFVAERRGGYPWYNGFANNNLDRQLPIVLKNNGTSEKIRLTVSDPIAREARRVRRAELRLVIYGLLDGDRLDILLNGAPVTGETDSQWPDKELLPLQPERVSGFHTDLLPDNETRFSRIVCPISPALLRMGENMVTVSLRRAHGYPYCATAELERVEIAVQYN